MSHFDEQPDADPHGECAAEIARLTGLINDHNDGCRAQCEARRNNGGGNADMCATYARMGRVCHDCPLDGWIGLEATGAQP